jgi:hypothetical protein
MTALLTLLPCGVVVVAILIFRLSGLVAAGLSLSFISGTRSSMRSCWSCWLVSWCFSACFSWW